MSAPSRSPASMSSGRAASPVRTRSTRPSVTSVDIFATSYAIPLRPTVVAEERLQDDALPKSIGLSKGVSIIIGMMIGSGIFASPGPIYEYTASATLSLCIWLFAGLLSLAGALCYVELGTLISGSGGEYAYLLEAFGPLVAFVFTWMSITTMKSGTSAVLATVTAQYAIETSRYVYPTENPISPFTLKFLAIIIVACLVIVNALSTRFSVIMQDALTWLKLLSIAIISISGIVILIKGTGEGPLWSHSHNITTPITPSTDKITIEPITFTKFLLAMQAGLWGFDGEIKDSQTVLKRSILIALPVVTLCYILTNMAFLIVIPASLMTADKAIANEFGKRVFGHIGQVIIPVCVVISTLGALNSSLFTASRIIHSAASQSHLPRFLSKTHPTRHTPVRALALQFALSVALIILLSLLELISLYSFVAFFFYALTGAALVRLRFTWRYHDRPYKVWPSTVAIFICVSIFLVAAPVIGHPIAAVVVIGWGGVSVIVWQLRQWWSQRHRNNAGQTRVNRQGYLAQHDMNGNGDEDAYDQDALELTGMGGLGRYMNVKDDDGRPTIFDLGESDTE